MLFNPGTNPWKHGGPHEDELRLGDHMPTILSENEARAPTSSFYQQEGFNFKRSDVQYVHMPLGELPLRGVHSELLKLFTEILPPGVIIAGGYVAALFNNEVDNASDVDLFFIGGGAPLAKTVRRLVNAGYEPDEATKKVVDGLGGLKYGGDLDQTAFLQFNPVPAIVNPLDDETALKVQCVKIAWFDSAERVIDSFDFTATQFAIDVGARELLFNPVSPTDYVQRRLVVHNRESDARLQGRIEKYLLKGFKQVEV